MRYRSVVLDVDSTLSGIEGIDWLAEQRGAEIAARVSRLTALAMSGEKTLDEVFELRLSEVRPSRADIDRLGEAYVNSVAPGAVEALAAMKKAGIRTVMVSGGIREAITPLATLLGISPNDLYAVSVSFTLTGDFAGHDRSSPLARQHGKRAIVESLELDRPIVAVGDGVTDAEMRPAVDCFVAFTGFTSRDAVVKQADATVSTFSELQELVLG